MKKLISIVTVVMLAVMLVPNSVVKADEDELIESNTVLEDGFTEEIDESIGMVPNTTQVTINWTVKATIMKRSSGFKKNAGSSIYTRITVSPAKKVRIGIIYNGKTKTYYETTTGGTKSFPVNKTGTYNVFVQNMTGTQIKAAGIYKK